MKKLILVFLAIAIIIFAGCNSNGTKQKIPSFENFVSYVCFIENENRIAGALCCSTNEEIKFTVTEPESIKGVTFSATKVASTIAYDNVSVPCENNKFIFNSSKGITNLFEAIFSSFSAEPQKTTSTQYKFLYSLGEAVVTFKNEQIQSIRAGEYSYEFTSMSESE